MSISTENFENCQVLELPTANQFIVTKVDKVFILDIETFAKVATLPIKLLESSEREPN